MESKPKKTKGRNMGKGCEEEKNRVITLQRGRKKGPNERENA